MAARDEPGAELGRIMLTAERDNPANEILRDLADGEPVHVDALGARVGTNLVDRLVDDHILERVQQTVHVVHRVGTFDDVIIATPDDDPGDASIPLPEFVYLGPDSRYLVQAVIRLAPRGTRAVDLGAGTGLLSCYLSRVYETVVATDLSWRVARAARITLALNERPVGHAAGAVVADVARGLRTEAFDLVVANPPWVPTPVGVTPRLFADGGPTGTELPLRFLHEAAALLRPGGVALVLCLDVRDDQGIEPIADACRALESRGFTTARIRTPLHSLLPELEQQMRMRDPHITAAEHVLVVIGAPQHDGNVRFRMLVAAEHLTREWAEQAAQDAHYTSEASNQEDVDGR